MALTYGSLFTGIGGFDLGFDRAGMECKWQVELDEKCQGVLSRHWPDVEKHRNVKEVGKRNLTPTDVICGGFPCQDLSVAGKRAGLAGGRSGLWYEFHRILAEIKPRWVVIENVPGLLSSNGGRDFAAVLSGLAGIGYLSAWRVLDAQYFGVAQRRRRVFVVASLNSGLSAQVLFEREGGAGDTPPSREAGKGFAAVAGTLSANRGGTDRPAGNANELDFCIPVFHRRGGYGWSEYNNMSPTLQSEGESHQGGPDKVPFVAFQQNQRNEVRDLKDLAGALPSQPGMKQQNYLAFNAYQRTVGEVHSPLTSEEKGRNEVGVLASFGVRRLTPTECERLQGFPDGWTDGQSDSTRYRQLGNAVAVPCAEWIGRRIVEAGLA